MACSFQWIESTDEYFVTSRHLCLCSVLLVSLVIPIFGGQHLIRDDQCVFPYLQFIVQENVQTQPLLLNIILQFLLAEIAHLLLSCSRVEAMLEIFPKFTSQILSFTGR